MTQPTVCAILLTADRPEMARRAVESFRSQTYPAKRLLILDSGVTQLGFDSVSTAHGEFYVAGFYVRGERGPIVPTIGELRNMANRLRHFDEPDIFVHFDDDDWSHPNRIAEQVALLQSSGADCVGFREMLFWRDSKNFGCQIADVGEAWLYSNPDPRYCLGTSLCYWRRTWERKPFEALPTSAPDSASEDARFITGLNCVGISGTAGEECAQPRMVARIHAGNTSQAYDPRNMERSNRVRGGPWRRVPEWDSYCRSVME